MTSEMRNNQALLFILGLLFFLCLSVIGWSKLRFGFNFTDEGLWMVESWRVTAGDLFLKDTIYFAVQLYTLLNAQIFKLFPDITLLTFRRLQFILALVVIIFMGLALWRSKRQYWYLPWVLACFACIGLAPAGAAPNLNYYTYTHACLTAYIAVTIWAVHSASVWRWILMLVSGIFLWLISFCQLHMSPIILTPIFLSYLSSHLPFKSFSFSRQDASLVVIIFLYFWLFFLLCYQPYYLQAVINAVRIHFSIRTKIGVLLSFNFNFEAVKHIIICFIYLVVVMTGLKKLQSLRLITALMFFAVMMLLIIETSGFNMIKPYYRDWFSRPMWFVGFIIAFLIIIWFNNIKDTVNSEKEINYLFLIPCSLQIIIMSIFSAFGVLTILYAAIPITAMFARFIINHAALRNQSKGFRLAVLLLCLFPFTFSLLEHNLKFRLLDLNPKQLTTKLETGFGRGIYTNRLYADIYAWISKNAQIWSQKNDFILVLSGVPMVYLIAQRRPALGDPLSVFICPFSFHKKELNLMQIKKRSPQIAFVFYDTPLYLPVLFNQNKFRLSLNEFLDFQIPQPNPLSQYIKKNMIPVDTFKIKGRKSIICYWDKN